MARLFFASFVTVGLLLGMVVGIMIGVVAAYIGGWLDEAIMRLNDVALAFPQILLQGFDRDGLHSSYRRKSPAPQLRQFSR